MKKILILLVLAGFSLNVAASTGLTLTLPLINHDPEGLHGYRAAFWYQPESFIWQHVNVFFDASYGHWWVHESSPNKRIDIVAFAPTLRYYFKRTNWISPFMDLSIGLTYLSETRIGPRNLGMHFSFQDIAGLGVTVGRSQRLSISLTGMHYSNGSTCDHNSGITIPLLLNIGYRI